MRKNYLFKSAASAASSAAPDLASTNKHIFASTNGLKNDRTYTDIINSNSSEDDDSDSSSDKDLNNTTRNYRFYGNNPQRFICKTFGES